MVRPRLQAGAPEAGRIDCQAATKMSKNCSSHQGPQCGNGGT